MKYNLISSLGAADTHVCLVLVLKVTHILSFTRLEAILGWADGITEYVLQTTDGWTDVEVEVKKK